jgi:ribosomal protein S18 acetylase RimI-like enzyme
MILVRPLRPDDRDWVRDRVAERWGSPTVVAHGVVYEPSSLPGFVAEDDGRSVGLLTFIVEGDECEIVTIDAFEEGRGVGAALIDSVKGLGHERLWLITTNDNSRAQRFYERVGFRLVRVHQGAVERSRELKPEIPLVSDDGTPIRDELEYEFRPSSDGRDPSLARRPCLSG